jgi:hypothetical protein
VEKVGDYVRIGDQAAARLLMRTSVANGNCILFRSGQWVYVTDIGFFTNSVKVRKPGAVVEYWGVLVGKATELPNLIGTKVFLQ